MTGLDSCAFTCSGTSPTVVQHKMQLRVSVYVVEGQRLLVCPCYELLWWTSNDVYTILRRANAWTEARSCLRLGFHPVFRSSLSHIQKYTPTYWMSEHLKMRSPPHADTISLVISLWFGLNVPRVRPVRTISSRPLISGHTHTCADTHKNNLESPLPLEPPALVSDSSEELHMSLMKGRPHWVLNLKSWNAHKL